MYALALFWAVTSPLSTSPRELLLVVVTKPVEEDV